MSLLCQRTWTATGSAVQSLPASFCVVHPDARDARRAKRFMETALSLFRALHPLFAAGYHIRLGTLK